MFNLTHSRHQTGIKPLCWIEMPGIRSAAAPMFCFVSGSSVGENDMSLLFSGQ